VNRYTHEIRDLHPWPNYGEKKLRFNWNTPIHMSPNEKGTIYIGAQYLFRSRDHGQSWDRISPDLTTNDPEKQKQEESGGVTVDNSSAEMHTTIYSISESPKNGQIIWVGTDDGNVQITRDGAKTWTNVVGNISGLGKNSWVTTIEAGRFDEGHRVRHIRPAHLRRYEALRLQDDGLRPDVDGASRTRERRARVCPRDQRKTRSTQTCFSWARSSGSGFRWMAGSAGRNTKERISLRCRWTIIVVQARESDLVLATHGRGIWIVDDISPLRALTPDLMTKDATLLPGRPSIQYFEASGGWAEGDETFHGRSRPSDAQITYYQKGRHIFGDLKIEIFDQDGKLVDTVAGSKHRGLNRAGWGMRVKPPAVAPGGFGACLRRRGPARAAGHVHREAHQGRSNYTEQLNVVHRSAGQVFARRAQGAIRSRDEGLQAAGAHDLWS
jgi:hypothetical protein